MYYDIFVEGFILLDISPFIHSLNFYYGIPHTHTNFSDGKGNPIDALMYARSKELNFLFISDHSNFLDGVTKKNYEYDKNQKQYCEKEGSNWFNTRIEVESFNNWYNDFVALRGFEMRCFTGGHMSVINSNNYINGRKQHLNPNSLANWLLSQPKAIAIINHPKAPLKIIPYDYELNKVLRLVEVGNGTAPRKYIRCEEYYYHMLDLGWKLGAINGQDNHIANWGDSDNLTVILAENLDSNSLLKAMMELRTYSTETRNLKLVFTANGEIMGRSLSVEYGDVVKFIVLVEDKLVPIDRIQLISRGGEIIMELPCNNLHKICWETEYLPKDNQKWFLVKVIHSDGRCGISSPIFLSYF